MISIEVTRKMDAVVAEKVMRWLVCWAPAFKDGSECPLRSNGEQVPHYSSNISDAWLVVEQIKSYGFSWWFSDCGSPDSGLPEGSEHKHYSTAAIRRTCSTKTLEMGQSPEMPMAICLAALKAVDKMELY